MTKAIYAGSFDPFTNGHLFVLNQAFSLFNNVTVLIAVNDQKTPLFTPEERLDMIKHCGEQMLLENYDSDYSRHLNVDILSSGGFTAEYAQDHGIMNLIRGLRDEIDFAYEQGMQYFNTKVEPQFKHWFIMPPDDLLRVSSSLMKLSLKLRDWEKHVAPNVPEYVFQKMGEKR